MTLDEINLKLNNLYAKQESLIEEEKHIAAEINDLLYKASRLRGTQHD